MSDNENEYPASIERLTFLGGAEVGVTTVEADIDFSANGHQAKLTIRFAAQTDDNPTFNIIQWRVYDALQQCFDAPKASLAGKSTSPRFLDPK